MKILQFFQGPDGENSAKRLAGLVTTIVLLGLSAAGSYVFLKHGKNSDFLEIIDNLCWFGGGLLGLGVADILLKKKYDKPIQNPPSS